VDVGEGGIRRGQDYSMPEEDLNHAKLSTVTNSVNRDLGAVRWTVNLYDWIVL
jgi:hypothetical protein